MLYEIKNQVISLSASEQGAELQSLRYNGKQLLWQGDERYWTGRAPVLFPIVCGLRQNMYRIGGRAYSMAPHGFAKDEQFSVLKHDEHEIIFSLQDNQATREQYPFHFELQVSYSLRESGICQQYRVRNLGDHAMPFSLGIHTALVCPFFAHEHFAQYSIRFARPLTIERRVKENNLMTSRTQPLLRQSDTLKLDYTLFDEAAIALIDVPVKSLELVSDDRRYRARYGFDDYADLGIWTMPGAPFLCIEPWNGYDDYADGSQDIFQKPGIRLAYPNIDYIFSNTIDFDIQI